MIWRFFLSILTVTSFIILSYAFEPLPLPILEHMATREMRHHHVLWHNIRNSWLTLDNDTQDALRALGWEAPHPSQNVTEDGRVVPFKDNLSGEDFLYMHRKMLETAKEVGDAMDPPYVWPRWDVLPGPDDPEYPVPPIYVAETPETNASITTWKSNDTYYNVIVLKDAKFKSPAYLRNITLGELGTAIEYELHNGIHMRWSDIGPLGLRVRPINPVPDIDPLYDNITYDWLIDSYSSHANPYFYLIHYWIDDRVNDWMVANGLTEIQWNGTWVGGPLEMVPELVQVGVDHNLKVDGGEIPAPNLRGGAGEHDHHHMGNTEPGVKTVKVYEEVIKILAKAGVPDHYFYDMVTYDEDNPELQGRVCD